MEECKVCGKQFKKITATHLKKHNMTMKQYLEQYNEDKYLENEIIYFLNEYYITVRSSFLRYLPNQKKPETVIKGKRNRTWGLNDNDLKKHLQGNETIGVYFPSECTKLIGFDIDKKDIELLERLYTTLCNYNIDKESILCSFSGGKGYHVDIFLDNTLEKNIVNGFYEIILNDINERKKNVELRGGGGQGYKLPLGYHQETGAKCYLCNEYGIELNTKEVIQSIKKVDVNIIREIVEVNYIEQFKQMQSEIKPLEIYSNTNADRIKKVEQILENGVNEIGNRHNTIYLVALYLKDIKGVCLNDCIDYITNWVKNKWSYNAINGDKDNIFKDLIDQVKTIYKNGNMFNVMANKIQVTAPEVLEIFSIDVEHKTKTMALRKLYFILLIHSKAYDYLKDDGTFYMTYAQMAQAGACKNNRQQLKEQLIELEKLGKLTIVVTDRMNENGSKNLPNVYKLNKFETYTIESKVFTICSNEEKCHDCMYKALCYLVDDKGRRKHIKSKEYKELKQCPYNKRE